MVRLASVGENIKMCRERRELNQEDLALKIRVGTKTIERYESGEQVPDMNTILKLSTVLDVPASEISE